MEDALDQKTATLIHLQKSMLDPSAVPPITGTPVNNPNNPLIEASAISPNNESNFNEFSNNHNNGGVGSENGVNVGPSGKSVFPPTPRSHGNNPNNPNNLSNYSSNNNAGLGSDVFTAPSISIHTINDDNSPIPHAQPPTPHPPPTPYGSSNNNNNNDTRLNQIEEENRLLRIQLHENQQELLSTQQQTSPSDQANHAELEVLARKNEGFLKERGALTVILENKMQVLVDRIAQSIQLNPTQVCIYIYYIACIMRLRSYIVLISFSTFLI